MEKGNLTMRRQIAMALGGWLAVTAAGLAQQQVPVLQPKKVDPPRPGTPVTITQVRADGPTVIDAVDVAPRMTPSNGAVQMLPPVEGQYMPVQPVQSYSIGQPVAPTAGPIHYIPVQPAPAPTVAVPPPQGIVAAPTQTQYLAIQPTPAAPKKPVNVAPPAPSGQQAAAAAAATAPGLVPACATNNCGQPTCQPCDQCQQPTCCQPCGPDGQLWVSAEYLLWWTRGLGLPALVTGSPVGTPRDQAGIIGAPGTRILYGDDQINNELRSGFRLRVGGWLDCCRTCGVEGSYFFLGDQGETFNADCNTSLVLARPFFNVSPNVNNNAAGIPIPDSELVCYPDVVNGTISIRSNTGFTGFDTNVRKNFRCDCNSRIDWLAGFRYLQLNDDLTISEDLTVVGTGSNLPAGTRFQLYDSFQTKNEFWGGQVGLAGEIRQCSGMFVSWRALVALGTTHKEATINGATTISSPGVATQTYPGGLLALPTNIGRYTKNDFSVIPEINLNVGYQFSPNVRVFAGYTFLYWSNVTRAGDVIDPVINTSQTPPGMLVGPARPTFNWQDTDFWAQGFNFGAEVRY